MKKPVIYSIVLIWLFFFNCLPLKAAQPLQLPSQEQFPGWTRSGPTATYSPETLFNYINGGAELFNEFGFVGLTVQHYRKKDHDITLEIYRMDSDMAALGIFIHQNGRKTLPDVSVVRVVKNTFQWTLLKGEYFIQINSPKKTGLIKTDLEALTRVLLDQLPEPGKVTIFNSLPLKDRIAGTEFLIRGKYAMQSVFTLGKGDMLQLNGQTFGAGARYKSDCTHPSTVLNIRYETSANAAEVMPRLKTNLDAGLQIISVEKNRIVFRDYQKRYGIIRLNDNSILISLHLCSISNGSNQ